MSDSEEQGLKYSYRLTVHPKTTPAANQEEPSKDVIQEYINELLGVRRRDSGKELTK